MSTESDWILVKTTRPLNGPAVIYRGPSSKSCAVVRFNAAAVAALGLKAGMRITVYRPAKPNGKAALAIGTHVDGVSLNGKGGSLQCGGRAFTQAFEAIGKRYASVKFSIQPAAAGQFLAFLNPIETELAP